MPSPIQISPEQAAGFMEALQANLRAADLADVVDISALKPRDIKSVADVVRETVISFEESRRAAARKEKV